MPRQDQDQAAGHEVRRDACGRSFVERRGARRSTTFISRTLPAERRSRNSPAWRWPPTVSRRRSSAARARRDCGITKFATGAAGITIRFSHSSPRGSWCVKPNGGKKWTPAITVPQIRDGIAMLLRAAYLCDTPTQIANHKTRRLLRNEEARFYHYKARNRLPPLRINQRR